MGLQLSRQPLFGFRPEDIRIGELLVLAGVITQSQLLQTLTAQSSRLPIGQQLVMRGIVTAETLQSAIDAQSMIRDGIVHIDLAVECLKTAAATGKEFPLILEEFQSRSETSNMLGQLLLEAGLLTEQQLIQSIHASRTTGLPLGRVLEIKKLLNPEMLSTALELQLRIRDDMIERPDAIQALRHFSGLASVTENDSTDYGLPPKSAVKHTVGQPMSSQEQARAPGQPVDSGDQAPARSGTRMVGQSPSSDEAIFEQPLHKIESTPLEQPLHPTESTKEASSATDSPDTKQAAGTCKPGNMRLGELLVTSGMLSTADVMTAVESALESNQPFGQVLTEQGLITKVKLDLSLTLQNAVVNGSIELSSAIALLQAVQSEQMEPSEAVARAEQTRLNTVNDASFDQFLFLCGTISKADLEAATKFGSTAKHLLTMLVTAHGLADQATMSKAELCFDLFVHGLLVEHEAVALHNLMKQHGPAQLDLAATISRMQLMRSSPDKEPTQSSSRNEFLPALNPLTACEPPSDGRGQLSSWLKQIQEQPITPLSGPETPASSDRILDLQDLAFTSRTPGPDSALAQPYQSAASQSAQPYQSAATQQVRRPSATLSEIESVCLQSAGETDKFEPQAPGTAGSERSGLLWQSFVRTAESYTKRGQYDKAQQYYEYVIESKQRDLGKEHPLLVDDLGDMASILCLQGKLNEAELAIRRMLSILLTLDNTEPLKLADAWSALARIYFRMGLCDHSEQAILHALQLRKEQLGEKHPAVAKDLRDYARILRKLGFFERADNVYAHARALLSNPEAAELLERNI